LENTSWITYYAKENNNGQIVEYMDSTFYHYRANDEEGIPVQWDLYHREPGENYRLVSQGKREWEYDQNGNLITDRTWQRMPPGDWDLLHESILTYDQEGRIIEYLFLYYSMPYPYIREKEVYTYENHTLGELQITTNYYWSNDVNDLVPRDKGGYVQSENESYTIYWGNYIDSLQQFTVSTEVWTSWETNEEKYLYTQQTRTTYLIENTETEYLEEYGSVNRCDGETSWTYDNFYDLQSEYQLNRRTIYRYFDLAGCEAGEPGTEISVFPNPSRGDVNIYMNDRLGYSEILLVNSKGKTVFHTERNLSNYTSINLKGFNPGLYYLKVNNGNIELSEKILLSY
jgi:hypothetical protein